MIDKAADYLRPLLKDPTQAPQAVARVVAVAETFSGPLPHPLHLQAYENVAPGSANHIIAMAAKEQNHRHRMQNLEMLYPYLGWAAGFLCFSGSIFASVYVGVQGHEKLALALLGIPSLGVIGWFVRSRIGLSKDLPPLPNPAKNDGRVRGRRTR